MGTVILVVVVFFIWFLSSLSKKAKRYAEEVAREEEKRRNEPWDFEKEETYGSEPTKYFSYDDHANMPINEPRFKYNDTAVREIQNQAKRVTQEKKPKVSEVKNSRGTRIAEDFDLESAVIYSEILAPKYKEY